MRFLAMILPAIVVAICGDMRAAGPATKPSTTNLALSERISRTTPVIKYGDSKLKSFDVSGEMRLGAATVLVRASQPEPGRAAVRLTHVNGLPLLIWADDRAVLYDVARDRILYMPTASISFEIVMDKQDVHFTLSPEMPVLGGPKCNIKIDFLSILSAGETRGARLGGERYKVRTDLAKGKVALAEFDFTRKTPMTSFRVEKDQSPALIFSSVTVNEPVDPNVCAMPEEDALKGVADVLEITDVAGAMKNLKEWLESWAYLAAVYDPLQREKAEAEFGKVEWDEVKMRIEGKAKSFDAVLKLARPSADVPTTQPAPQKAAN